MSKRVQTSSETSTSPVQTSHTPASTPGITESSFIILGILFDKTNIRCRGFVDGIFRHKSLYTSWEGSKSSTHYLSDKNRFDVSSKGPSLGISEITLIPSKGPLLETSNLFLSLR